MMISTTVESVGERVFLCEIESCYNLPKRNLVMSVRTLSQPINFTQGINTTEIITEV